MASLHNITMEGAHCSALDASVEFLGTSSAIPQATDFLSRPKPSFFNAFIET